MVAIQRVLLVAAWITGGSLTAAEQAQDIPSNWEPAGMRRISVVNVKASSALTPEGEQYAPGRAIDGQRTTKWVANIPPSQAAPQWITLEFSGTQAVSAVAVFGERIGNDGIQDARVQVFGTKAGEFNTVATIADAQSGSWLATFDPIKTNGLRLEITRSSGPSPHTDVYEIEVYGPPISPAGASGVCDGRNRRMCRAMGRSRGTDGETRRGSQFAISGAARSGGLC